MTEFNRARRAATLIETLVAFAIISVMVGLTLGAIQRARSAAARTRCANNLRHIGVALAGYHATTGHLPQGIRDGADDSYPYMSWLAQILPQIEQASVWQQAVDAYRAAPWDFTRSPPHPFATAIGLYGCPADARVQQPGMARGRFQAAFTSYLGVAGTRSARRDGVLYRKSRTRFEDITDGTSCTLMVGERPPSPDLWAGWWYAGCGIDGGGTADSVLGVRERSAPPDGYIPDCGDAANHFRPGRLDNMCDAFHFWSLHPGGAHFLFADGSVRFVGYAADSIMAGLATRAGGEVVDVP